MLLILWQVILPIFAMVGLGFVVQRKVGLDLKTLTRLNFWVFVPAFLFVKIYESTLTAQDFSRIFLHFTLFFSSLGVISWGLATVFGFQDRMRRALTATVLFYNSGNYGVPVSKLAFPGQVIPEQVQAATVMMQNFSNFTLGLMLVAGGRGKRRRDTLKDMLKLPMLYVLVVALSMRWLHLPPPKPIYDALHFLAEGLVPIAVVTLGAQMAGLKVPPLTPPLLLSLFLRLVLAPVWGLVLLMILGTKGELAQAILISTSFPTAVNAALLALEYDNEPQYVAAAVFYSTLFSAITVSGVIYMARVFLPG